MPCGSLEGILGNWVSLKGMRQLSHVQLLGGDVTMRGRGRLRRVPVDEEDALAFHAPLP